MGLDTNSHMLIEFLASLHPRGDSHLVQSCSRNYGRTGHFLLPPRTVSGISVALLRQPRILEGVRTCSDNSTTKRTIGRPFLLTVQIDSDGTTYSGRKKCETPAIKGTVLDGGQIDTRDHAMSTPMRGGR
ncbi:hypothetical protein J6590_068648 [Homalodisca vitripennis]|nr:hypothetical protein J6590_068648 [Homalodisca vitripennis]